MRATFCFHNILLVLLTLFLAGISAKSASAQEISDPFESYNRTLFSINDAVYRTVLEPIAKGYRVVIPQRGRTGLRNFLSHLRSPITLANQILQGDINGVGVTSARIIINTLLGFGGIIDIAAMEGLKEEQEDFGQTLAVWGVPDGPYIVPPIFPPASLRDQAGFLVDTFADPVRLYLFNTDREAVYYVRVGLTAIDQQEALLDVLSDLRKNSVDYYAAVRSITYQRRNALIKDLDPSTSEGADIPDYGAGFDEEFE